MPPEVKDGRFVCTQCGGEGALESGQRFLICRFCDATLFVDQSGVVSHFRLPRLLGEDEACLLYTSDAADDFAVV